MPGSSTRTTRAPVCSCLGERVGQQSRRPGPVELDGELRSLAHLIDPPVDNVSTARGVAHQHYAVLELAGLEEVGRIRAQPVVGQRRTHARHDDDVGIGREQRLEWAVDVDVRRQQHDGGPVAGGDERVIERERPGECRERGGRRSGDHTRQLGRHDIGGPHQLERLVRAWPIAEARQQQDRLRPIGVVALQLSGEHARAG